jgi:hypothetical protein
MQSCPRCAKENTEDAQFCSRCGLDLVEFRAHQARASSPETSFCFRHPKRSTNLACGRCGKPFCTDCLHLGPAGPRCKECAKQNIAFRPSAVLFSLKRKASSLGKLGPWGIYALVMIGFMIFGGMRSCAASIKSNQEPKATRPLVEEELPDQ